MRWRLLLEEFGPHIHHIAGVDNTVADVLSRLKSSNIEKDENDVSTTQKLQEVYTNTRVRSIQAGFPLENDLIRVEQRKELQKRNSNLKSLLDDKESGYHFENIDGVELVLKDNKIYIPASMRESTLNWYHHYLNHPGGDRLGNTIKETCYWKGLSNQPK